MTTDSVPTAWTKDSEPQLVEVTSTHANNVKKHSQIIQRLNAAVNIPTGTQTLLNSSKLAMTPLNFPKHPLTSLNSPQLPSNSHNSPKLPLTSHNPP